jgi:hypothetical protein
VIVGEGPPVGLDTARVEGMDFFITGLPVPAEVALRDDRQAVAGSDDDDFGSGGESGESVGQAGRGVGQGRRGPAVGGEHGMFDDAGMGEVACGCGRSGGDWWRVV